MPCFSTSSFRPFLPIPVCFGPRIAISVPIGRILLVSGTNVTLVWSLKSFVNVIPCLDLLPIVQPALCRRLINCLPEGVQTIIISINHCRHLLNMRTVECFSSHRCGNSNTKFRPRMMEFYRILLKESFSFPHILKRIEMKQHSFVKFPRSLWNRATKCGRAKFLTTSHPPPTFSTKLVSYTNITFCRHGTPSCFTDVLFNVFSKTNTHYTTISQGVNAKLVGIGLVCVHSQARSIIRIRSSGPILNFLLQRMVAMIITLMACNDNSSLLNRRICQPRLIRTKPPHTLTPPK